MSVEMKSLTVGGTTFEVVDAKAREIITEHNNETENTKMSYEIGLEEIEVPTMDEFNQAKEYSNYTYSNMLISEKSGAIVSFDDTNPLGNTLKVKSTIAASQEGSGDPSPENIRPITGRDAASVTRCGRNLVDVGDESNVGWATDMASLVKQINKLPAGTYCISFTMTLDQFNDRYTSDVASAIALQATFNLDGGNFKVSEGTTVYRNTALPISKSVEKVITITEEMVGHFTHFYVYACGRDVAADGAPNGVLGTGTVRNMKIELGSTATPYEPYTGDTYTATLPETVYGGELDWNTGVLTVDKKLLTLSGTETVRKDKAWALGAYEMYNILTDAKVISGYNTIADLVCSHTKNIESPDAIANNYKKTNNAIGQGHGVSLFIKMGEEYDTIEKFKDYLAAQYAVGTPVQVCYKLETPHTIQLTPQQITALSGTNTLYTDSGDTVVVYNRDINKAFAELQQAIISLGGNV